ncbi:MAG: bifunctional glutamate N-acetyltransferase/amino-acid acetyltransferase ArgJ [Rhodobacteraceae bacterium]|jgi:glutamate N-acetyltransferase/amino-acid N-acetyltransferase|nr:bifunctional glutamate N-acetyltransferase/amino-acid acetyltransferase ArgJ [Paracoccaceae bacterium]
MATITKVSPLAPEKFPDLPVIDGVRFATAQAGVKYKGRTDVMLVVADAGSTIAGVFTRSATRSAPVLDCQEKIGLDGMGPLAIVVNSGNSNAFTGKHGRASVAAITAAAAAATGVSVDRVFTSSTGVIGEPLPHDKIVAVLDQLNTDLDAGGIAAAARAIMTTDTYPKGATVTVDTEHGPIKIAGMAKGSGMIAPDMATMLVYIFTDAKIAQADLQAVVSATNDTSFNCITVDSDTSTSDTLLMVATGASGVTVDRNHAGFRDAVNALFLDLAHQVVRDGEGASKFVEVQVTGAQSDKDAKIHAMAIANSPLIKTAIAGQDPNWGRVVMAIGKSGAAADRDLLSIWFGDILVAEKGWRAEGYTEDVGAAYMKNDSLIIRADIGLGTGTATVWTCDLTHGYIEINADYRS